MHLLTLDEPVNPDPALLRTLLARHGALLLRNQPLDIDHFEALSRGLCRGFHHVGTRRKRRAPRGDGYTTEVFRKNFRLLAHSEGTYRPHMPAPSTCFFLCQTPPAAEGGETTLVDGVEMAARMPPALRRRLREQGIIYECHWEPERWRAEFSVHTRAELRALLDRLDNVRYRLDADDRLELSHAAPAIRIRNGEENFCNGLLAHLPAIAPPHDREGAVYTNPANGVRFGDGEPFPEEVISTLVAAHDTVLYRHSWRSRELLILDNRRVMHGREMTAYPCDRVIISRFGW